MTTIAFVGAGSVVFTRQLLADILGFPELADATIALHDIDPDRLATAEGIARQVAGQLGARADHHGVRPTGGRRSRAPTS